MVNNNNKNSRQSSALNTFSAGEDPQRLADTARSFGLHSPRRPRQHNVRDIFASWLMDDTLEAARMHAVGVLGQDERVDNSGTIHQRTLTRRLPSSGGQQQAATTYYGNLTNLFRQGSFQDEEIAAAANTTTTVVVEEGEGEVIIEETVEGGSLVAAIFGIIKGMVGPAILYLPRGFQLSGYAVAIPSMIVATACYLYSASCLLECWRVEKQKGEKLEEVRALLEPCNIATTTRTANTNQHQYGSIDDDTNAAHHEISSGGGGGGKSMLTYPELSRRAFGKGSAFVKVGIATMQFGVCLTYLIFVPQNLVECTKSIFDIEINKLVFLIGMVLIEIPLVWIQDIRKLTPTNIMATFLIAYGLASCLIIAFVDTIQDPDSNLIEKIAGLPAVKDTWFLFIGTSFFIFEGSITLLLPLQEAVFTKEDKEKFPSVNQNVICTTIVFYIVFAITCWAAFGENVKTALTASLPSGGFATSVQFAYSVAVMFTFPLQAFPAFGVVFQGFQGKEDVVKRNIGASFMTCFLGLVAYFSIDYLGNVVSLLGSLVGIPIALIYPPLMHNQICKDNSRKVRTMNYIVAGFGFVAMAAASYTTIASWDEGAEG